MKQNLSIKSAILFVSFMCLMSCNSNQKKEQDNSLKGWILSNQHSLMLAADTIIQSYNNANKVDSNWTSSTIAITRYGPGTLGAFANKIHDSTGCVVVELTFYKDTNKKRRIMLAAQDSGCLKNLNNTILETDSTNDFIFGKASRIEN